MKKTRGKLPVLLIRVAAIAQRSNALRHDAVASTSFSMNEGAPPCLRQQSRQKMGMGSVSQVKKTSANLTVISGVCYGTSVHRAHSVEYQMNSKM